MLMLLSKTPLYPVFQDFKRQVESRFHVFANVEIVKRSSCDVGSLLEDIALVVYLPKIKAWYASKPDRGRTSKCWKEVYSLNAPESVEDKYHRYFKISETLEFQRIVFLRPYNYESNKDFFKLYASSSDINLTKDGYYFDFQIAELGEVIEILKIPKNLVVPNIKKTIFSFSSCSFESCLLSNQVKW